MNLRLPSESIKFDTLDSMKPILFQHLCVYKLAQQYAQNKTVIDVGCGSGYGSDILSNVALRVTGIDRDINSLAIAREKFSKPNLEYKRANIIEDLSIFGKFEVVTCFQVLEHIKDQTMFIKNLKSLLTDTGVLIISTPNFLSSGYNCNPYHVHEFTFLELKQILTRVFRDVKLCGVNGSRVIKDYEESRRNRINFIFKFDIFNFRKSLYLPIRIFLFNLFTILTRIFSKNSGNIQESDYTVGEYYPDSMDLIAICRDKYE